MMRLWPQSLAGQLIAGLVAIMVIAHLVSFFAFIDERRLAVHEASRFQSLSRIASAVQMAESLTPAVRKDIIAKAGGPTLRLTLSSDSQVERNDEGFRTERIRRRLIRRLGGGDFTIHIGVMDGPGNFWRWGPWRRFHHRHGDDDHDDDDDDDDRRYWPSSRHDRAGGPSPDGMLIAVRLSDGTWLNARTLLPPLAPSWAAASVAAMVGTALALIVLIILLVRRATRPLANLADAAERTGRGEAFVPLPETGPRDVRETIAAFNRMQERQQRDLAGRTRMLAAISHDLRTPITSLRIRAEFIEDAELRAKFLATLDEMQAMAESTLSLVREDTTDEAFVETDIVALVESACADDADLGRPVDFTPPAGERLITKCRPMALRRALRNIVDNAIAYAGAAEVQVERHGDAARTGLSIVVMDRGPGISEVDLGRVFEPFVRLEGSRSKETGGMGLGMSIARTILRAQGGEVTVTNRNGGGLRVSLDLPGSPGDQSP